MKLNKICGPIWIWPILSVVDFDLANMVCYVTEMDILQVDQSVADMDMAEYVCGQY